MSTLYRQDRPGKLRALSQPLALPLLCSRNVASKPVSPVSAEREAQGTVTLLSTRLTTDEFPDATGEISAPSSMHNVQRTLLAASCLSCFAFLKYCCTPAALSGELAQQHHSRLHIDSDGFVTCDGSIDTDIQLVQQAPTLPINHETHCADHAGIEDLAIILKTGSTEIYEKLPVHFTTTFLCVQDRLIYSDVQQYFSGEPVRDALVLVSQESRKKHSDLEQHVILNDHVRLKGDAAELKGDKSWHIDKWKFLPMISDAYATFGERKKWYLFIEADTYVSLHNLLPWLAKLDHKRAIYAGAQVMISSTEFGHGGSGFLLSSSAAKALNNTYHSDKVHWESVIASDCCGDKVMAEVLQASDPPVRLLRAFPQIQGETLSSLDWSTTHWCRPAITWHHVDAAGIDKLWQFDLRWRREHGADTPILFKDYYAAFIHPRILAANGSLHDWDNLSDEWTFTTADENPPAKTAQTCERFCNDKADCVQWAWRPGSCKAGSKVRFGWALKNRPKLGSAENRIERIGEERMKGAVSGWLVGRIEKLREEMGSCGEEGRWVTGNVD
jgi:hypothetical protein